MTEALFQAGPEDFQQAEWLAQRLGSGWRYDHSAERWHHFDGIRWAVDKTNQITNTVSTLAAKHLTGKPAEGIKRVEGEVERKALMKLLSLPAVARALTALATFPEYGTDGSDWDNDPHLLGVANGIVDLRKNALMPNSPNHTVTRNTGVPFDPIDGPDDFARAAPQFIDFLSEVTSDYDWTEDPSVAAFLLLWFGASVFGMTPEQRFLLMTGSGRNGKGALRHALMQALGPEYASQPDSNLYSRSKFGPARSNEARADLMQLRGIRIAFFSEPDKGQFNEEMLKAHTGGDIITARGLYQRHPVSWEPTHSINFLVNDAPSLDDVGPSMGSRVVVVDFRHRYEGSNEDKSLYGKLASERAGVLSILCWAAKAWYDRWMDGSGGLTLPSRVVEASKAFMERNDPIAEALRDAFTVHPDEQCASQVAYDAYRDWHTRSGADGDPMSMVKFSAELEKKGFRRVRTAAHNAWKGLSPLGAMALAEQDEDDDD